MKGGSGNWLGSWRSGESSGESGRSQEDAPRVKTAKDVLIIDIYEIFGNLLKLD
ncbi:MAG: hypothetical protein WD342_00460 [Verrucomicrobiales bacterium]